MGVKTDNLKRRRFVKKLLDWGRRNRRRFPWREAADPYRVLVAELMLQRTQAPQVEGIYQRFFEEFPTLEAASCAPLRRIEKILGHLGLNHRIPRIHRILKWIAEEHGGRVPDTLDGLKALPGVGDYIAHAVLCFGYGRDVPILDPNVYRVLHRVFGLTSSKKRPRDDPKVWGFAAELVPAGKAKLYNEALLDLGAVVCRKKPLCPQCPVRSICEYYHRKEKGHES